MTQIHARATLRVAVIGLSGSGKSTCAGHIAHIASTVGLSHTTVKLADPLYRLQRIVYQAASVPIGDDQQDQILMESLAEHLRRISPTSIVDDFLVRLRTTEARVVINDDLRDPHVDAGRLREHGFRMLRVTCDEAIRRRRLRGRGDISVSDRSTREIDLISADAILRNDGSLDEYHTDIEQTIKGWL